jgi:hypothetical protein
MLKQWMPPIGRVYDQINTALWGGLIAFLLFFAVVVLPHVKKDQAAYEAGVAAEISAENDSYCRRFRFVPATDAYRSCLDDLQRLRMSIEKRVAADYEF